VQNLEFLAQKMAELLQSKNLEKNVVTFFSIYAPPWYFESLYRKWAIFVSQLKIWVKTIP